MYRDSVNIFVDERFCKDGEIDYMLLMLFVHFFLPTF